MTDFIHEQPKEVQAAPPAREEPPMDEKTGQKRVYGYIFILFLVAFGLLVWSFLMNQRSNDEVLHELRGNADALQTTLTRNVELERQADKLQEQIDKLEAEVAQRDQENEKLKDELTEAKRRATAHGHMWMLECYYAMEKYDYCRTIIERLQPERDLLLTGDNPDFPAERERYDEIVAALAEMDQTVENP